MIRECNNRLRVESSKLFGFLVFFNQISMIANQTRAKTEQLAKMLWLITSARVL